ncbi:MAG: ferrous iron transport protein B [Anaerolineae bacterium]|nr:ferrous iron transport protein B [Anaerolineae bacterium]
MRSDRIPLVALAGQPNVGKSTVFNLLTGLSQHVGNWPGKTIERREGTFICDGRVYRLVDLPGTYSLTANSAEEVIAREFIVREKPDVVVALVDAAILERSLYLVAELVSLPAPVIVGLNMMDVAHQEGLEIDVQKLEAALGVRVVPMSAAHNVGVRELVEAVDQAVRGEYLYAPRRPAIRADHAEVLAEIERLVSPWTPSPYPPHWVALKLLEGDEEITRLMQAHLPAEQWETVHKILKAHEDALVAVASGRYEWIRQVIRAAVSRPRRGQISLTERLDRWAAHPFWGLVILAGILGLAFWLTYTVGLPLVDLLDAHILQPLAGLSRAGLEPISPWLAGLVADGLIGGGGFMLTFLPILVIFFAIMGILEDVGYMARAAYVMDGLMHPMGLHGKSFLPLFLGFGCNVPAVLGTRVIESRRARLLTALLAPLIPCTARMTVVAFLTPIFFGAAATWVSWGVVLLSLVVLAASGMVISRVFLRGERAAFIMELPLYHIPNPRTIGLFVWQRTAEFLRKAVTVILPVSLLVWALSVLPGGTMENSYLAWLGYRLEPLGRLMGLDWRLVVALLSSFIAKENAIATLGVVMGTGEDAGLARLLAQAYPPATGLAFLAVQVLFIPCVATVAALRQEVGWRWTLFNLGFQLTVAVVVGAAVYWLARLGGL